MKKTLKEIAEIRPGYQFRGRVEADPEGSHRVIQIRDFDDEQRLKTEDLITVTPKRDPSPFIAQPGEVLFLSRGHKLWAAHLDDPPKNAIVTGYFFILRPKTDPLNPAYLAWYLNQTPFQNALRQVVRGSQMPLVSMADFKELAIEAPPTDVQAALVALAGLRVREREIQNALEAKRGQLIDTICLRAVRAQMADEGEHEHE